MKVKAFKVHPEWLDYAHGPGADEGQPLAVRLLTEDKITDPALVEEIIDVAELYTYGSNVQEDDRLWFRAYPGNVIKRGKAWLKQNAPNHVAADDGIPSNIVGGPGARPNGLGF